MPSKLFSFIFFQSDTATDLILGGHFNETRKKQRDIKHPPMIEIS